MKRFFLFFFLLFIGISLWSKDSRYDIVVAKDGSGDYTSIQEAVNSVRGMMADRKTIFIKKGIYKEKIVVPTHCINITLLGEDKDSTIVTWADHANILMPGENKKLGTFRTYTLLVQGHGFRAENLTIENNAPQLGQAVALHVEGDRAVFVNCKILGNQDTVYAGSETSRQYYYKCYIEGTTDFIFGPSTVYFESCSIHSKKNSYITAPSTPQNKQYGFVFDNCELTADNSVSKVYLGRPWRPYGQSVFVNCNMGAHILAAGWDNWRNPENEKTVRFIEINNIGEGARLEGRVSWSKKEKQSKMYSKQNVLAGCDKWNPKE